MIPRPARPTRILIVEDEQETRDAIEVLLKRDGYRTTAVRNEEDAVEKIGKYPPDLILVSLHGSPEHVVNTAWSIREKGGLSEGTPIVIFSIATVPEGAEEDIGSNTYVTLPDNFNQLRALLTRLLGTETRTH
jgi:CheY-like chemotaxis protein